MAISRRALLLSGGAALLGANAGASANAAQFVSAFKDDRGYGAALLDADAEVVQVVRLRGRGHGAAVARRRGLCVVFARRPGRFALAVPFRAGGAPTAFAPPSGRAFNGHGFFSADETLLYATENAFDEGVGVLGVYDATAGFQRVDERPAGGIGPHEAILLADGRRAAVAVGGIETHPDYPRRKLNLPSMRPALAFVDLKTGAVEARLGPHDDRRRLSIRHIAKAPDGAVWFGGQWEGDPSAPPPLIGRARPDGALEFISGERGANLAKTMRGYIGSIALAGGGRRVIATSPRGGAAVEIDAVSLQIRRIWRQTDIAGVAPTDRGALATAGDGAVLRNGSAVRRDHRRWDNHLAALL